jgi:hypothetical protein
MISKIQQDLQRSTTDKIYKDPTRIRNLTRRGGEDRGERWLEDGGLAIHARRWRSMADGSLAMEIDGRRR